MVDPIFVLSIFAAGVGCGYYVRHLISKKRRDRYLEWKRSKRSRKTVSQARAVVDFAGTELTVAGDVASLPSRPDQAA
jgi:hypothetical protein